MARRSRLWISSTRSRRTETKDQEPVTKPPSGTVGRCLRAEYETRGVWPSNRRDNYYTSCCFVKPIAATSVVELPRGREWLYEIKLDGYRVLVLKDAEKCSIGLAAEQRPDPRFSLGSVGEWRLGLATDGGGCRRKRQERGRACGLDRSPLLPIGPSGGARP